MRLSSSRPAHGAAVACGNAPPAQVKHSARVVGSSGARKAHAASRFVAAFSHLIRVRPRGPRRPYSASSAPSLSMASAAPPPPPPPPPMALRAPGLDVQLGLAQDDLLLLGLLVLCKKPRVSTWASSDRRHAIPLDQSETVNWPN